MKKLLVSLFAFLLIACANPAAPVNPTVEPVASSKVVFVEGKTRHVILFGTGASRVSPSVVNQFKIGDSFSKVYSTLKIPALARAQPDNGVVLVYNVAGTNERVYFVFRGGGGTLIRISNSPNTQK